VGQSAIIALGVAAVMLLAGARVLDGTLTVGDLVLVNAYVIQVCLPLNSLGFVLREANDALIRAERLFALLAQRPDPEPPAGAVPQAAIVEVRFENVTFGYEPSRLVLQDVNFAVPPGRTVAVVGGSGSGKSTLARLLLRFYDPSSGRIFVDGAEVRELPRAAVRAAIGVVPQDTPLFNDTIAYNIAYGRIGATHDEVVAAAKAANVHDFVAALPAGYDTLVGERGLKLSGGEKQRIAIARAILKDAPILILDEATSALDSRAERAIQGALERLAAPRTTLIIAHRLATIVAADEILVLDRGRIVERGRHSELLERGALYAQMWALQQAERELRRSERRAVLQPVNPSALVANAIDAARADIESKGIHLYTMLGLDVGLVTGDPGALHSVVFALLAHAIEVSEPGARVELDLERAGNEVRLRVVDTSGVTASAPSPAKDRRRTPARRFDPTTVRAILEEHHGRFAIEQAGTVTTYVAALPVRAVAPTAAPAAAEGQAPARAEPPSFEGRSLLIVDDDEDARESLRLLLELHHAEVLSFASGHAALDYLKPRARTSWPDLMICDIGLPDEDGYRVLRRVRGVEAEHHVPLGDRMPAIALTGYAQAEDRMRALVAGFQAHLAKPALPQELLATIGRLLGAPA
jgi:ATP-binding cassette subfamily B protein